MFPPAPIFNNSKLSFEITSLLPIFSERYFSYNQEGVIIACEEAIMGEMRTFVETYS
jgi:hypothetical protein